MGKTILPTAGDLADEVRHSSAAQVADMYGVTLHGVYKRLNLGGYTAAGDPVVTQVRTIERTPRYAPLKRVDETWMTQAACLRAEPDWFYPEGPGPTGAVEKLAKSVCESCPVRVPCLSWALDRDAETSGCAWGILGGLNGTERDALRKKMRKTA